METAIATLGIGSRVKHPSFGVGVVIRIYKMAYDVCFVQDGIKQVGRRFDGLEIIEAIEPEASISYSEAEIYSHFSGYGRRSGGVSGH